MLLFLQVNMLQCAITQCIIIKRRQKNDGRSLMLVGVD